MTKNMPLQTDILSSDAKFSIDQKYRYSLSRVWNPNLPKAVVIGLNPSTATAEQDDPTIRRCIEFSHREGCGSFMMLNIFAYRSTDPHGLELCKEPIGEENDNYLISTCRDAKLIIAAWGSHGKFRNRGLKVRFLFEKNLPDKRLLCFGKNKDGEPVHPLYQPKDAKLQSYI